MQLLKPMSSSSAQKKCNYINQELRVRHSYFWSVLLCVAMLHIAKRPCIIMEDIEAIIMLRVFYLYVYVCHSYLSYFVYLLRACGCEYIVQQWQWSQILVRFRTIIRTIITLLWSLKSLRVLTMSMVFALLTRAYYLIKIIWYISWQNPENIQKILILDRLKTPLASLINRHILMLWDNKKITPDHYRRHVGSLHRYFQESGIKTPLGFPPTNESI